MKPSRLSGVTTGYSNSSGFELYTNGKRFVIRKRATELEFTAEEMRKILTHFAPYFKEVDFGIVED